MRGQRRIRVEIVIRHRKARARLALGAGEGERQEQLSGASKASLGKPTGSMVRQPHNQPRSNHKAVPGLPLPR